jgi:hypothetical protein
MKYYLSFFPYRFVPKIKESGMKKICLLSLVVLWILSMGCVTKIPLMKPAPKMKLDLSTGESPAFTWSRPQNVREQLEFTLEIARDVGFQDIVFTKEELIQTTAYQPSMDELFLPGAQEYHWRVSAQYIEKDGSRGKTLPCQETRSFLIKERPKVKILFKVPPADDQGTLTVVFREEEYEEDFENDMEVGDRVKVSILLNQGDEIKKIGGKLRLLKANETTEYGMIIIDNVTQQTVQDILGGSVGDFSYELGGDKIVEMKLGSRIQ